MAARAGDAPPTGEEDPLTASDAVSLHTIAEQADAYAAQEQEDADFALALALEEEESNRFARSTQATPAPAAAPEPQAFAPYRDDPEGGENDADPPPYRDDPEGEGQQPADEEAAANLPQRENRVLRIVRVIAKAWLRYLICMTVFTILIIVVVAILALFASRKQGSSLPVERKKAAWDASGSEDFKLNLPKLYPALEGSTSDTCKKSWEDVAAGLPCHRMILSPAWDNGDAEEAKAAGADPVFYNQVICTRSCKNALNQLDRALPKTCVARTNRFDFDRYGKDGKAYFEDEHRIEEGPAEVSKSLLERYDRLCNGPPKKHFGKKPLTCAEDLYMTWGIIDGKNEDNLNGLELFLEQTSVKKTIPATKQTVVKLTSRGTNTTFTRNVNSRRVGPGRGETECSDCLEDWLLRKTLTFRHGQILKPGTRTPMGLVDFDKKLREVTQRCYAYSQRQYRIWEAVGWWCSTGEPCNMVDDKPEIPAAAMNIMHGYDKTQALPFADPENVPSNKKQAVKNLMTAVQEMRCGALGLTPADISNPIVTSPHVISRLCTPRCLNAVDRIADLVSKADHPGSPFAAITDSISTVHALCKTSDSSPVSFGTTPDMVCAPGYAALNLTSLISTSPLPETPSHSSLLSTFETGLSDVHTIVTKPFTNHALTSFPSLQKIRIANTACNTCAGELFIGKDGKWKETVDEYLGDKEVDSKAYVKLAREGWVDCGKMFGMQLREREKKALFEKVGLGVGVGEE